MYDVAIINGNIADGTGAQIYRGNIYIKDGIIKGSAQQKQDIKRRLKRSLMLRDLSFLRDL